MNALGGDITCASKPGEYTQFTLTLPVYDEKDTVFKKSCVNDEPTDDLTLVHASITGLSACEQQREGMKVMRLNSSSIS